jgi:hypothetical protein
VYMATEHEDTDDTQQNGWLSAQEEEEDDDYQLDYDEDYVMEDTRVLRKGRW